MKKYKFGFIVEVTWDEHVLRNVYPGTYPIVILHGCGLTKHLTKVIDTIDKQCEKLLIATDPDEPGELVASKILEKFPHLKRLKFDKEKCKCIRGNKIKIGIQHASYQHIREIVDKEILGARQR